MPDPCTAQGLLDAVAQYVRVRPEVAPMAMLLRHGGGPRGWWRLVAVRRDRDDLTEQFVAEARRLRRGLVAVVFCGQVERVAFPPRRWPPVAGR